VIFSSPSERSRLCRNSSRPPKRSEFLLSWDSSAYRPSAVRPPMRPLPEACAPFGPMVQPIERVPPSGFLTPSAACSASALRVCCAPLPAMGSVAFPGARPILSVEMGTNLPFPAPRIPYEEFPSSAAVPHRCGHCLLAVTVRPVVSPARLPGLTKSVANKFIGVLRREEPTCAVPRGPSSFRRRGAGVDLRRPKPPDIPEVAA